MHHCSGNLSKLPYICIVWSFENWYFNDPCFMNPGCFQSQLVLASTWKAILRHDVLSSGFAAWMFFERSASAKKALKHNIHAKKTFGGKHMYHVYQIPQQGLHSKPCSSNAANGWFGACSLWWIPKSLPFWNQLKAWKYTHNSKPHLPPNQQVVILLNKINHTYHTFTYPWSKFTNWYSLKHLAPGLDEIFGDPNKLRRKQAW